MKSQRPERRRRALLAGALVAVVVVAVGETGLRVAGYRFAPGPLSVRFANALDQEAERVESVFQPSPTLFWELRPGAREPCGDDAIATSGLRGPERAPAAQSGTLRIALLGDSCTYGVFVAYPHTYGARLEARLEQLHPGRRFEVLNGGVPGYTLYQSARLFDEKLRALAPGVVVLYLPSWNDFGPAMRASDAQMGASAPRRSALAALLERSRVAQLLSSRVLSHLRWRRWRSTVDQWLAAEPPRGYRVPLDDFTRLLEALLEDCAALGARTLLVLPELNTTQRAEQARNFERLERYRAAQLELARARGLPTLDLRELFPAHLHGELFADVVHPSRLGYAWLGLALAEALERAGWIGPGAPALAPSAPAELVLEPATLSAAQRATLGLRVQTSPARAGRALRVRASRSIAPCAPGQSLPTPALLADALDALFGAELAAELDAGGGAALTLTLAPELLGGATRAIGFTARIDDGAGGAQWSDEAWLWVVP